MLALGLEGTQGLERIVLDRRHRRRRFSGCLLGGSSVVNLFVPLRLGAVGAPECKIRLGRELAMTSGCDREFLVHFL